MSFFLCGGEGANLSHIKIKINTSDYFSLLREKGRQNEKKKIVMTHLREKGLIFFVCKKSQPIKMMMVSVGKNGKRIGK